MSHKIEWIVKDHLVVVYLKDLILPVEVHDISIKLYNLIQDCQQQSTDLVHMIIDSTEASIAPHVREYMKLKFQRTDNAGWTIITGSSMLMKMIVSIFSSLIPGMQFVCFPTVDEAVIFMSKRDLAIQAHVEQKGLSAPVINAPATTLSAKPATIPVRPEEQFTDPDKK